MPALLLPAVHGALVEPGVAPDGRKGAEMVSNARRNTTETIEEVEEERREELRFSLWCFM
jgi:hypothetical protein